MTTTTQPTVVANQEPPADLITYHLNLFFNNEKDFCKQAKAVADSLQSYKEQLQPVYQTAVANFPKDLKTKYAHIDLLINLYNFLSVNYFDLTEANSSLTDQEKIDFILDAVNSKPFGARVIQLSEASRLYPALSGALIPAVKDKPDYAEEARKTLQDFLSAPMTRLLRMKMSFETVEKEYLKQTKTAPENLKRLLLKFSELADAVNNAQTIEDRNVREQKIKWAQAATITPQSLSANPMKPAHPKAALETFSKSPAVAPPQESQPPKFEYFLKLFDNRYNANHPQDLDLKEITRSLQQDYLTPLERLQALEKAFGLIRTQASLNKSVSYFFRKKFPYTKMQLKDIHILKQAYLAMVASTPYNSNPTFEKYLATQYPSGSKAEEIGGLLSFNRTTWSLFVQEQTRSLRKLEDLKAGEGRIKLHGS